jgi:pimeloyl-ACP methyl ester carboxylesterase
VVLVHGLAANQAFWNFDLVTALARQFRVTTFDLRGHGYSSTPPTGYRPADLAEDLHGLMDHLGITRAHLAGHSYGGVVALQFALGQPQRVISLTVADSRIRAVQPRQPLQEQADWPALKELLGRYGIVIDPNEPELGIFMLEALASPHWDDARLRFAQRNPFVPFGSGAGKRSARRWLRLLESTSARQDFRAGADLRPGQLRRFDRPLLAVYGETSPNRPTGHYLGAGLPKGKLVIVPGVGHFHPVTRPEFFRDTLLGFLVNSYGRADQPRRAEGRKPPGNAAQKRVYS